MPLLGFGKEGLDPDLPFAHRLLVGLGQVVAADFVEVLGVEGAVDDAAVIAGGALGLHRTRVAGRRVGTVDDLVLGVLGLATREELPLRAAVGILPRIVGE